MPEACIVKMQRTLSPGARRPLIGQIVTVFGQHYKQTHAINSQYILSRLTMLSYQYNFFAQNYNL